jgi:hypothetical protein
MDLNDRAHRTVKAMEEYVYRDCLAKGRLDLLDAIREGGYELRDEGDQVVSMWVGTERVIRVRLNAGLPDERLN